MILRIDALLLGFWIGTTGGAAWGQDVERGLELMRDSTKGNCSICHMIPGIGLPEEAQGNIGPPLSGIGTRLSEDQIRERITDARRANPATVMPPYGVVAGLIDVDPRYSGSILTADEIADIAAYLHTLGEELP